MKTHWQRHVAGPFGLGALGALVGIALLLAGGGQPVTGPETEKRFPPLKVPAGFKATLFACDPLIEYPSAIAAGPERDSLFVAVDYMTGWGTEIIRKDEIRLLRDTNGDGYADKVTIYAHDFNSIQGMTYHNGTVYVMHAPFLTALRDTDGDGKADERKDLITGLGLPPEKNPVRLHCANGVVMGHDGWLYLALGDHGCDVPRPEGDQLVLNGGGILRCRPDGSDLHVFATGLRNIYDVALDADLNVFVRDNENDGGTYMIRVCHSFFGADHGYPYLYEERPDEALAPLADLGRGSSAGGLCYLESTFPAEYRNNLFFCEWGRAVVWYPLKREGSGFAPVKETDFATGAANDPYSFKPTDLAVDRDGALFVADWCDGQRPKRGRGRIYRIIPENAKPALKQLAADASVKDWIEQLDSPSHWQRVEAQNQLLEKKAALPALKQALKDKQLGENGRKHAVWILALGEKQAALPLLFAIAKTDPVAGVRLQAVRAIADLGDTVLSKHLLAAGPGSDQVAQQLTALAEGQPPAVLLEIVVALGRLQWSGTPAWLQKTLQKPDAPLGHAAMQAMRRSQNWPAILSILDQGGMHPLHKVALAALSDQYQTVIVDGLIDRLHKKAHFDHRQEYADALTRVYKKPGPWKYWGYRPPPRPPHSVEWPKTKAIAETLDEVLHDKDFTVRHYILERMLREKIPTVLTTLGKWLDNDHDTKRVETILKAAGEHPAAAGPVLAKLIKDKGHTEANRLAALKMFAAGLDPKTRPQLLTLADCLEDGPVLAQVLHHASKWPDIKPTPLILKKLKSASPVVRAAAIDALVELKVTDAALHQLLDDPDHQVQQAVVLALGQLNVKSSADAILKLASTTDPGLRSACLDALRLLKDARAVPLATASLDNPKTQLAALHCLAELGGWAQGKVVADLALKNHSLEVLPPVVKMLSKWSEQEPKHEQSLQHLIAQIQGKSGNLLHWRVKGPVAGSAIPSLLKGFATIPALEPGQKQNLSDWQILFGSGLESGLTLPAKTGVADSEWLAFSDLFLNDAQEAEVLTSTDGKLRIWLDGKLVHQMKTPGTYKPDSERFGVPLAKGWHRFFVAIAPSKNPARFHLQVRKKSSSAEQEKWIQLALNQKGNYAKGKEVFFNVNKSQCLKCHKLGNQGESIGPDLTNIGKRFSRTYIIESIVQPSQSIAPSYETLLIELKDGKVLTGTKIEETATVLVIGDKDGKKHTLPKNTIELRAVVTQSVMPDNLVNQFTEQEFVDLIAFLEGQK